MLQCCVNRKIVSIVNQEKFVLSYFQFLEVDHSKDFVVDSVSFIMKCIMSVPMTLYIKHCCMLLLGLVFHFFLLVYGAFTIACTCTCRSLLLYLLVIVIPIVLLL